MSDGFISPWNARRALEFFQGETTLGEVRLRDQLFFISVKSHNALSHIHEV